MDQEEFETLWQEPCALTNCPALIRHKPSGTLIAVGPPADPEITARLAGPGEVAICLPAEAAEALG